MAQRHRALVRVLEKPPGGGRNAISTLNYPDWEKQNTVFEHMTAQVWGTVTLTGLENPEQVASERVSVHFFDVFKDTPALGRVFAPGEDQVGQDHVAVISHSFWINRYGGDPGVLGRTLSLDGEPYMVIGVMPAGIFDRTETKIWRPLAFGPENMTRDFHWFGAWALLKPGVTLEQARTQMDALAARIAQDYPKSNKGWGVGIDPFSEVLVNPQLRQSLCVLMGAVVVAEVALAFMLLTGAGLLIRSFFKMQAVDTGFDATNVITAYLPISGKRFHSADEFKIYLRRIAERIRSASGSWSRRSPSRRRPSDPRFPGKSSAWPSRSPPSDSTASFPIPSCNARGRSASARRSAQMQRTFSA